MAKSKIILGFVGKKCAGKGFTISYLAEKYAFVTSSLSDRVREEVRRRGLEITRENQQQVAGELRNEFGPLVLAERTWQDVEERDLGRIVIDSIASPAEVEYFKNKPNFHLVALDADQRLRYERMVGRGFTGDPITWENFVQMEERENNKDGRNMGETLSMAEYSIENNGIEEELYQKIDQLLQKIDES